MLAEYNIIYNSIVQLGRREAAAKSRAENGRAGAQSPFGWHYLSNATCSLLRFARKFPLIQAEIVPAKIR